MKYLTRRSVLIAGLALVGLALLAPAAQAQPFLRVARPASLRPFAPVRTFAPVRPFPVNNFGRAFPAVQNIYPAFVPTQLQRDALRNWSFQTRVIGRTYASLPPWLFGYNPYTPFYLGPVYPPVPPIPPLPPVTPVYPYPSYFNPYNTYTPPVAPLSSYSSGSGAPYPGTYVNPYAAY
jgi:hypothetical protein